jgi:hypothetical protein
MEGKTLLHVGQVHCIPSTGDTATEGEGATMEVWLVGKSLGGDAMSGAELGEISAEDDIPDGCIVWADGVNASRGTSVPKAKLCPSFCKWIELEELGP